MTTVTATTKLPVVSPHTVAQPAAAADHSKVQKSLEFVQTNAAKAASFLRAAGEKVLNTKVMVPLSVAAVAGYFLKNPIYQSLPQTVKEHLSTYKQAEAAIPFLNSTATPAAPVTTPVIEPVAKAAPIAEATKLASTLLEQAKEPTGIPYISQGTAVVALGVLLATVAARRCINCPRSSAASGAGSSVAAT